MVRHWAPVFVFSVFTLCYIFVLFFLGWCNLMEFNVYKIETNIKYFSKIRFYYQSKKLRFYKFHLNAFL
jgi:hypothetical protein